MPALLSGACAQVGRTGFANLFNNYWLFRSRAIESLLTHRLTDTVYETCWGSRQQERYDIHFKDYDILIVTQICESQNQISRQCSKTSSYSR